MDRRQALKNISLTFGSVVATPVLFNILNSCSEVKNNTAFLFLNDTQELLVNHISKVILPKTHFFGVEDMNLTHFTDQMLYYTTTSKEQTLFNLGCKAFEKKYNQTFKENILKDNGRNIKDLFIRFMSLSHKKEQDVLALIKLDFNNVKNSKKEDFLLYNFLTKVRYYCLFGYCTSEAFHKNSLS